MKKVALFLVAAIGYTNISHAQGFYIRGGVGYALPQAGQTMDGTATPLSGTVTNSSNSSGNYTTYNIDKASLSSGVHGALGCGYMFNEHIGIDAAFDLGLATTQYTLTYNNVLISNIASNVQIVQKAKAPILMIPSLVLQSGGDMLNLYTRFGVVLPLKSSVVQDQIFENLPGTGAVQIQDYTWEIKNKFSVGMAASAGVQYAINSKVKVYGEVSFVSLALYASEAKMTEVSVDRQPGYLQQVPVSQQTITFSNNFTSTSNDYFHQPVYTLPFSYLGINVGLTYNFKESSTGKKSKGKNDVKVRRR